MRILFVSDYASWNPISKGEMPSNHLFGIHQKIKYYYTDQQFTAFKPLAHRPKPMLAKP